MKSFWIIAVLFVLAGCSHSAYNSYTADNVELDSTYNSEELEGLIAPYRDAVSAQMDEVIGVADSALVNYAPESPLGNFAADILFEKGMTLSPPLYSDMSGGNTIALLNFGGLRSSIDKGNITIGNVFELMPFDNTITIVKIDASGILDLVEYLYTMNGQPVSNSRFKLSANKKEMLIESLPVELNRTGIYVITSDYLAAGGDKMNFLRDARSKWDSGILLRDVFIEYIKAKGEIEYTGIDGRMIINK